MYLLSHGVIGGQNGFWLTSRWLVLPSPLYFSLLLFSLLLFLLSGALLVYGFIRKKPHGHFIRWGAVLLLSLLYLFLALGINCIIADTMLGGL
ncbi:MAG: hypothetical protein HFG27_00760 [Provencibacterium sp.]|jgi:heme A synthase|nr:hypothetical protein [Provencibacterium sp.]